MSDFKGRKDFPEVADNKIKIGDYSGTNRLSVTDIYSPKAEPELRDQIMEPVKGKTNNYDSPILSQQPVITLSDTDSEAALIRAINGYVAKQGDSFSDVEEGFSEPKRKEPREEHPSRAHDEEASPRQRRKPRRNREAMDVQKFSGGLDMKPVSTPLKTSLEIATEGGPQKKGQAPRPEASGQDAFSIKGGHPAPAAQSPTPSTPSTAGVPANVKSQLGGTGGASPGVGLGQGERRKRKGVGFLGRLGRGVARLGARGAEGVARMGADASGATGIARRFGNRRVIPQEMALADILNELETYVADQQPNNSMVEQQLTKGNISKMMRNTEEKAPRDWKYHV